MERAVSVSKKNANSSGTSSCQIKLAVSVEVSTDYESRIATRHNGTCKRPVAISEKNQQRTRSALRRFCDDQIAFAVAVEVTENNVPSVWHTAATRREDGRSKTSVAGTQFGNYVPRCKGR